MNQLIGYQINQIVEQHMKANQMSRISQSSKIILHNLKNTLKKRNYTLASFCNKHFRFNNQQIDKKHFSTIFSQCDLYFSGDELEQLYTDIFDHGTEKILLDKLNQVMDSISQSDISDSKNEANWDEILEIFHRQKEIIQIINIIIGQNKIGLTKKSISQILDSLNYTNQQKKQAFTKSLLNGRQSIPKKQFIQKLRLNDGNRSAIKKISSIRKIKEESQTVSCYFNISSKWDKPFEQMAMGVFKREQIFKDQNNPKYSTTDGLINPSLGNMNYFLFAELQEFLIYNQRNNLIRCISPNDIIPSKVSSSNFLSALTILVEKNCSLFTGSLYYSKIRVTYMQLDCLLTGNGKQLNLTCRIQLVNRGITLDLADALIKTFAKISGSYERIKDYTIEQCFELMTGSFRSQIDQSLKIKKQLDLAENIVICKENNTKDSTYILKRIFFDIASSKKKKKSLLQNHQYEPLLEIRRYFGQTKLQDLGLWNFQSKLWTKQLRQQLDYKIKPTDGTFFMCQKDFITYFKKFNIYQIKTNYKNSFFNLNAKKGEFHSLPITIKEAGSYSLAIYLKDKQNIIKKQPQNPRYSWMFLIQHKNNKYYKTFQSGFGSYRDPFCRPYTLQIGNYILVLRLLWQGSTEQHYHLTSYGPQQVQMESTQFNEGYLQACFYFSTKKQRFQENKNIFKTIYCCCVFGLASIQIENQEKQQFDCQIKFKRQKPFVVPLAPCQFPIHPRIGSGQKRIFKFVIPSDFVQSQITFNYKLVNQNY